MRLSTQSRYGVRAIFDIAYHSEGLGDTGQGYLPKTGNISTLFGTDLPETEKGWNRRKQKGSFGRLFLGKETREILAWVRSSGSPKVVLIRFAVLTQKTQGNPVKDQLNVSPRSSGMKQGKDWEIILTL